MIEIAIRKFAPNTTAKNKPKQKLKNGIPMAATIEKRNKETVPRQNMLKI